MRAIVLLLAAALCCGSVHALVPHVINHQGYLTNPGGAPISGTVQMQFRLYDGAAPGANLLYTETQSITLTNGVFTARIGSVTTLPLAFDVPYWLGITVGLTDPEMTPRQPLAASAYALTAAAAESLAASATVPGAQIADNTVSQAKLSPSTGAADGKVLGTNGTSLQWQAPGPTVANYVYAYDTTQQVSLMPNNLQPVAFSDNALLDGWIHGPGETQFIATIAGVYRVHYTGVMQAVGSASATLRLTVNNVEVPGSGTGFAFTGSSIPTLVAHEAMMAVVPGDALSLQFTTTSVNGKFLPAAGPLTIAPSATILIERIR